MDNARGTNINNASMFRIAPRISSVGPSNFIILTYKYGRKWAAFYTLLAREPMGTIYTFHKTARALTPMAVSSIRLGDFCIHQGDIQVQDMRRLLHKDR